MEIHWDWSALTGLGAAAPPTDLRPVEASMHQALTDLTNVWEGAAVGARLPGMTRTVHDPAYAASLDFRQLGQLAGTVGSADAARDARAQEYREPWDMKPGLLHGPKSRVTQARPSHPAHRFNIIPMRHRAETVSTEAMWALVQNLTRFDPQDVPRLAKFTPVGVYVHRTALEAGIRLGRSGPVTFRTVSETSPPAAWWYPARLANPIAESVWALLAEAITQDLALAWATVLFGEEAPR